MKVIMSACQATHTILQNKQHTKALVRWLQNNRFTFEPVQGCYKGKKETSFLIEVTSFKQLQLIKEQAVAYNQECILTMLNDGSYCCLLDPKTNTVTDLGNFKEIPPYLVSQQEAYTIINNKYYITVKEECTHED